MIKKIITKHPIIITPLLMLLMITLVIPGLVVAKDTSISNSISVSSDSNGSASITSKTIIDGVVREDNHYETSGANTIKSITVIEENTSTTTPNPTSLSQKTNAEILLMIERLNVLIQYYVLLLNKTS